MPHEDRKAAYEHLRAAHLNAVRASLEDHVARLEWAPQRIEHYRTERLRSLLAFARERSPFHAARMADIDPLISEYQVRQTAGGADVVVVGSHDVSAVATPWSPYCGRTGSRIPKSA